MNDHARSIAAFVVLTMAMMTWDRPAHAEGFLTPFVGFNFGGDSANCISLSNCDEKRLNWGVSFGSRHGIFGFEEDIGYAPSFFGKTEGGDNAVLTVMSLARAASLNGLVIRLPPSTPVPGARF